MHGVGYEFSVESFKAFNLNPFIPVVEQIQPDPEFPTVKFPNPEEGKSALNLAIKTANENGSTIILANDPDADRLAVAEKKKDGEWKIFNGNEIGSLFGWWLWHNYKQTNKEHFEKDPNFGKNAYMLYSTVSSQILNSIAKVEGFNSEDTLTGFKWMGNRTHDLLKENKKVLFAFEEAIGFMCGTSVLDKDGVSAEATIAEMAIYLKEVENKTLSDQLDAIYDKYGYHVSNNSYFLCYEQENIRNMFNKLRHYTNSVTDAEYTVSFQSSLDFLSCEFAKSSFRLLFKYPDKCGPYKIQKIRDLTADVTIDFTDNGKISKPVRVVTLFAHFS